VPDWLEWVWRAWTRLNADRPYYGGGMGPMVPGRIPWRTVDEWARRHGLDMAFLDRCLFEMDSELLAWHAAQQPVK
jgi:hypothetical protein